MTSSAAVQRGLLACVIAIGALHAAHADDAQSVFDALYSDKLVKARSTGDRGDDVALAEQMLADARTSTDAPRLLALQCEHAYRLGASHLSGYSTAFQALRFHAEHDRAKSAALLDEAIELLQKGHQRARGADKLHHGERLLGLLLHRASMHVDRDALGEATADYRRAASVAKSIRSKQRDRIEQALDEIEALTRIHRTIAQLERRIDANPDDKAAAKRLAEAYLVDLDHPVAAAPYVSALEHGPLKSLLVLALTDPDKLDAFNLAEMGDGYRKLAGQKPMPQKAALLNRARDAYASYLDKQVVGGATRIKIELFHKEITEQMVELGVEPYDPPTNGHRIQTPTVAAGPITPNGVRASGSYGTQVLAHATDGNKGSSWSSGSHTGWIELDLGEPMDLSKIVATLQFGPAGPANHTLYAADRPMIGDLAHATKLQSFSGNRTTGDTLATDCPPGTRAQYIQLRCTSGHAWFNLMEIEVFPVVTWPETDDD